MHEIKAGAKAQGPRLTNSRGETTRTNATVESHVLISRHPGVAARPKQIIQDRVAVPDANDELSSATSSDFFIIFIFFFSTKKYSVHVTEKPQRPSRFSSRLSSSAGKLEKGSRFLRKKNLEAMAATKTADAG